MAIIIKDYEPSGNVVEVQFPGSKKRYEIAVAEDALTVGVLEQFARGEFSSLIELFPEDGQEAFRALHPAQVQEFVTAWTGDAKN